MKLSTFQLSFVCLTILGFSFEGQTAPGGGIQIQRDIVYATSDGVEMHLDLAQPKEGEGPFPLVLCFHGGGWQLGNKAAHWGTIRALAQRGYVAATVQYRFTPKYKWPAQVEDTKAAVRYLRSRATELKI